jgi:diguanylate cyclase (GGDEF)-like protein
MKILIAEDDPISRHLLQATLRKWGHEVHVACNGQEAWEVLQQPDAPHLAVVDWMMPEMDGVEICRRLRELQRREYIYVILLTAKSRTADVIVGMDAGADDYITKPFDAGELKVRIRAARRILDLQSELLAAHEALRHQATHDALTGLLSRAAIFERLDQELDRTQRDGNFLAVIMADIDKFKRINDTYGHSAGDVVLREVAQRMLQAARPYDGFGRYGGEEFLMVIPGCEEVRAAEVAERFRHAVSAEPIEATGRVVAVTVSLGVASALGSAQLGAQELIRRADAALYRAKASGRDRVECADGSPLFKSA